MTEEIKPCPFCAAIGAKVRHWKGGGYQWQTVFAVVCQNPDCAVYGPKAGTEEGAIVLWNMRRTEFLGGKQ